MDLAERGELAFKLRSSMLAKSQPSVLEVEANFPSTDPVLQQCLAFEWLLDECRTPFRDRVLTLAPAMAEWIKRAFRYHEEPLMLERMVRCTYTHFIERGAAEGIFKAPTQKLRDHLNQSAYGGISEMQFLPLAYEIHAELMEEYVREILASTFKK
ncbi:MAG: hypothetical protein V4481_04620 [Patescibacteria group bacterium]